MSNQLPEPQIRGASPVAAASAAALRLTIYKQDAEVAALIEYRQDRLADTVNRPTEAEIQEIDREIRSLEISPERVAGVVAIAREWRSKVATAKEEIARLRQIMAHYECMEERLKEHCGAVLEEMPIPKKGSRKLAGSDGSMIMLKGNGGVQPLVFTDSAKLPIEVCRVEGWVRADLWETFVEQLPEWLRNSEIKQFEMLKVPDNGAIREALAQPCPACGGHPELIVPMKPDDPTGCAACGGSGKNAIPGVYLAERGNHVEFR